MLDHALGGGGKAGQGSRRDKGRNCRRRRECAGQDYCAVEWDGDLRWEGYCLPALEIRIAGEGFSLPEVAKCSGGAGGLGHDKWGERSGGAALWGTSIKRLQRD